MQFYVSTPELKQPSNLQHFLSINQQPQPELKAESVLVLVCWASVVQQTSTRTLDFPPGLIGTIRSGHKPCPAKVTSSPHSVSHRGQETYPSTAGVHHVSQGIRLADGQAPASRSLIHLKFNYLFVLPLMNQCLPSSLRRQIFRPLYPRHIIHGGMDV